ncbi:MAG: ankyrin repeat domain-containing protein [Candidatus Methylopumilus sp.]|nr:ankyrin repeat domain-containing protein [Candidatus Methylopumilus sp.]
MNKFLKTTLALILLTFSMQTFALTDAEQIEFSGAVNEGKLKIVKKYIEVNKVDINQTYFAWSPLLMAAAKDQFEVLKYLTDHGADLNYTHPLTKMNAFHHAAFDGRADIVKYLAAKGADINKRMKGGVSIVRVVKDKGDQKMADLLLSLGVSEEGCEEKCL